MFSEISHKPQKLCAVLFLLLVPQLWLLNHVRPRLPKMLRAAFEREPHVPPLEKTPWNKDVLTFNSFLSEYRKSVLPVIVWDQGRTAKSPDVFTSELRDDYFRQVARQPDIITFALRLGAQLTTHDGSSSISSSNSSVTWALGGPPGDVMLPRAMYVGALEATLCASMMRTKPGDVTITCRNHTAPEDSVRPLSASPEALEEYRRMLRHWESVFLHVIPNAMVSSRRVTHGDVTIRLEGCVHKEERKSRDGRGERVVRVEEVFVARHEGRSLRDTMHGLARLALYVPFLRQNPDVRVMVPRNTHDFTKSLLRRLGVAPSRVIRGNVAARVAYLPQSPRCGPAGSILGAALLQDAFLGYTHAHHAGPDTPRDVIVLVQRTRHPPKLAQHEEVRAHLEEAARQRGLQLRVHTHGRHVELDETVPLFHRAALVVTPHGAGLANLVFSRPATVVIDIKCSLSEEVKHLLAASRALGHVYYAMRSDVIVGEEDACVEVTVNVARLARTVDYYLDNFITNHP